MHCLDSVFDGQRFTVDSLLPRNCFQSGQDATYSFLSHCIAKPPFASPSAQVRPTKCFLDFVKAIKAPTPKEITASPMAASILHYA